VPLAPVIAAPPDPAGATSTAPDTGVAPPADGFERALAAQNASVGAQMPTVTLGQMVEYAASGALRGAPPVGAFDSLGPNAEVAVAAGRPASALSGAGTQVLGVAERYLGTPYLWGGTDPAKGLDCSGFVQQVFSDLGIRLPRVSIDQSRQGDAVASLAEARPGDLLFWGGTGSRPNHIGIYAGDGMMIHAPQAGDVVRYQEVSGTPHAIRRVIP
jgi:peptidoglycan DL-endopeptidase CwlO